MSNPLDDYIETREFVKQAGIGDFFRRAVKAPAFEPEQVGSLVKQVGMVAGAGMMMGAAKKLYMAATKSTHHRKMLEVNPDLVEHQRAEPAQFNQHYSSLRNLNPQFARDPVVAGSYMRHMSEMPQNAGAILVDSMQKAPQGQGIGLKDLSAGLNVTKQMAPPTESEQVAMRTARNKEDESYYKAQHAANPRP